MKLNITINKKRKSYDVPVNRTLLDFLRSQGLWSVKHGCESGTCGNCTILVQQRAVYPCLMLAAQTNRAEIETFESINETNEFRTLKETFLEYGDIECAYCVPGFMMAMKSLLVANREPDVEEVVDALSGVICRCTKEPYPIDAIMKALRKLRGKW